MANYQLLKADIDAKVYENAHREITGENLNSVLKAMVATLGAEYQYAGVATIDTNPGTPDAKVFYIANGKGTYTNFGSLEVTEDDVVVLYWDTAWHKVSTGIASQAKLSELDSQIKGEATARTKADAALKTEIDGKQEALTLTVKDNGNIVLANIQGQSKEFMPATPSGDPMHYAYVAAGAEYNDTGADIVKTAPWADMIDDDYTGDYGKTVVHKTGCWYLNGLGDITNDEIRRIYYRSSNIILTHGGTYDYFSPYYDIKTMFPLNKGTFLWVGNMSIYSVQFCHNMSKCIVFNVLDNSKEIILRGGPNNVFFKAIRLVHSLTPITISGKINNSYGLSSCESIVTIKIKGLNDNLNIAKTPVLSIKSVLYMINNEAATSPIAITLHANVFNRCMANADILAALQTHTNVSLASA